MLHRAGVYAEQTAHGLSIETENQGRSQRNDCLRRTVYATHRTASFIFFALSPRFHASPASGGCRTRIVIARRVRVEVAGVAGVGGVGRGHRMKSLVSAEAVSLR
jgi:hypothetical protein